MTASRVAGRVLLVLFGLFAGLALAEAVVRIGFRVIPPPKNSLYIRDPYAVYRLRPDPPEIFTKDPDHYTNSLGFRDREHPVAKPPRTYRVLGIGDSFVYGAVDRLPDLFLKVAEATVQRRLSDSLSVEMILMGIGGYSPENEVGVLKSVGLRMKPDLVVLNFFVGNDVTGIPLRGRVLGGQWYPGGSQYPWLSFLRRSDVFVLSEKYLLPRFRGQLLRLYLSVSRRGRLPALKEPARASGAPSEAGSGSSGWYLHGVLKDMPVFARTPDRRTEQLWREAEGYLLQFDELCRDAGVPWLLLLIPAQVQIDRRLQEEVAGLSGSPLESWDFDAPQARLTGFARSHGIETVDLLGAARESSEVANDLYIPNDGHWTVRGNRIAGEHLAERVLARLSTPAPEPGKTPDGEQGVSVEAGAVSHR